MTHKPLNVGTDKPLLLLDVDGVLNPLWLPKAPAGFQRYHLAGFWVNLSARHGIWLNELAKLYYIIWCTAWEDQANELIAPILGLPSLPVIRFPSSVSNIPEFGTWKLPSVKQALAAQPATQAVVWIDDDLEADAGTWAKYNTRPILLLKTRPTKGFTKDHYQKLLDFAILKAKIESGLKSF